MTTLEPHFLVAESGDGLEAIHHSGRNLVLWEREPLQDPLIGRLMADPNPFRREWSAPDRAMLAGAFGAASAGALVRDILNLTALFGRIAGTRHPRVRLERVEDSGCALFHADSLRLRLLCTYSGPGTEWLGNEDVNWNELGLRGRAIEEANAAIVRDTAVIRRISTGAVGIFSGRGREDVRPLVHRSAPLARGDRFRLRLCIDLPGNCAC